MALSPRRRRRSVRGFSAVALFTLTAGGIAAAGTLHVGQRLDAITRIDLGGSLQAARADQPGITAPVNYLIVGSDSRSGAKPGDPDYASMGPDQGDNHSDTLMVLRLDPSTGGALLLSLPRDLYVPIAGTGKKNRINTAYPISPSTVVRTVESDFNIPIQHFIAVNFQGFKHLVDAIGGVQLCFPSPARDTNTGLNVPAAGCYHFNGVQALAFARSRHYAELRGGRWIEDGTADLGRIKRQQEFMRTALQQSISAGLDSPFTLNRLLDAVIGNLTIDSSLGRSDLTRLARQFKNLSGDKLQTLTLPANPAVIGGMDVLRIDAANAEQVLQQFR